MDFVIVLVFVKVDIRNIQVTVSGRSEAVLGMNIRFREDEVQIVGSNG